MEWLEVFKAVLFGLIEGITEWLPVSSTGHMILLDQFVTLNLSVEFKSLFLVVIQLGAILAVVVLFWPQIFPLKKKAGRGLYLDRPIIGLWLKIIVACLPAAVIGILFEDQIDALFYNPWTVSIMLILIGICFILIEEYNKKRTVKLKETSQISYKLALMIGLFQVLAAVFPGTSRSGATILGGILLGMSRQLAAEFTFFLAIPVMFGASLLRLLKMDFSLMGELEWMVLLVGSLVAFAVSYLVINFLLAYVKKHDFKVFAYYRIALGVLLIAYFALF